ncbi:hypothetical protein HYX16_02030 [Candidatus Woesearchaeota archaeon]|nr:hypothetical protein [Candidatus Woesearchaeota archaeon]
MNKENKIMLSIFFILLISLFYYNLSFNITGRVIDPVEAKDICLKESNNKYNTCIEPCGISISQTAKPVVLMKRISEIINVKLNMKKHL